MKQMFKSRRKMDGLPICPQRGCTGRMLLNTECGIDHKEKDGTPILSMPFRCNKCMTHAFIRLDPVKVAAEMEQRAIEMHAAAPDEFWVEPLQDETPAEAEVAV